jgi:autotransporter-associated beta strand protein
MKKFLGLRIIIVAFVLAIAPLVSMADTYFYDDFTGSSTLNQTPVSPTTNAGVFSTSYETYIGLTNGSWSSGSGYLSVTFQNTGGVLGEVVAQFTTNPIVLGAVGDNANIVVVFTNSANILSGTENANASLNIGLYYSGGVLPNKGNIVMSADPTQGGTQGWIGYFGRVMYNGSCAIITRPAQNTTATAQNQDLLFNNASSSQAFNNPTGVTVGTTAMGTNIALAQGATFTLNYSITLSAANTFGITNTLYAGAGTNGNVIATMGKTASGSTYLVAGFDSFAIGWRNSSAPAQASTMDISSVKVSGQSSAIAPPIIDEQPVPISVATNVTGVYKVKASGVALSYQWHRNGTNLIDAGNISGAKSDTLVINSVTNRDVASGVGTNGYWVTVTAGIYSTNSVTNSLTLRAGTNLVWSGAGGGDWDINKTISWLDPNANATVFNFGDAVTFNNSGSPKLINLTNSYLCASSVTMDATATYLWQGNGGIYGAGNIILKGGGQVTIKNANNHTGGTIITNGSFLYLYNLGGLGTGPLTLYNGSMEVNPVASAGVGIRCDVDVREDFTISFDGSGAYCGSFYGNLSGTAGKTLTFATIDGTTNRVRIAGTNTVCNANLAINGTSSSHAIYDGACLAPYHTSGYQTYNGIISGNGGLVTRDSGTTILNNTNTYTGGTTPTTGTIGFGIDTVTNGSGTVTAGPIGTGPLSLAPEIPNSIGSGAVVAWNGARIFANPIVYPSATNNLTLIIGGTNALNFVGAIGLNGLDNTGSLSNRTFQVTNTALTTFSGVVSDGGGAYGLIKTGNGVLALNNTETYTGPTTNSGGTLQINGSLDASSTVTVNSNATLAGTGTINGSVIINAYGTLAPGTSIGKLTIGGNLTLNGNLFFEINKTSNTNDVASVTGTLANGGTGVLYVTNLGSAVSVGDKFVLFNKAMTGGGSLTVSNLGSSVLWSNGLAVDGSITVLPSAPPTVITQPAGRAVAQGASATLTVAVSTVTGVTNYLWQLNSNTIAAGNVTGTTSNKLTITGFQAANAGYYRVVVGDGSNSTNSSNALVTLAVAPTIANSGLTGSTLTLQVPTENGPTYLVQTNGNLATTDWQTAATIVGDGTTKPFTTSISASPQLFIRVKLQ